jgi:hypothetical protein
MKLTRQEILNIAKENMLEYVHETYLVRFSEQIIMAEEKKRTNIIEDEALKVKK